MELEQDELVGKLFGNLEVIGCYSRDKWGAKLYTVSCAVCTNDRELFHNGYFETLKSSLISGKLPCGCSKAYKWTESQYILRCQRAADERGMTFIEWDGNFKGNTTRCIVITAEGNYFYPQIRSLLSTIKSKSQRGSLPRGEKRIPRRPKPDDVMVESFLITNVFAENTKFSRRDNRGYWDVLCGKCGESYCSKSYNLQRGSISCKCSPHSATQSYINLIYDNELCVALKFGISKQPDYRLYQQQMASPLKIIRHSIWKFTSYTLCKQAEGECKNILKCGVVGPNELADGWTETTSPSNIEYIEDIFKRFGGQRI